MSHSTSFSRLTYITAALLTLGITTPVHADGDAFFAKLEQYCGKAFAGVVSADRPQSGVFSNRALVMHVRECSANGIRVPFHVGDDRSRTWVFTKTDTGLRLKHDHRHEDGSEDALTQYGGDADPARSLASFQAFPADKYSKNMFDAQGIPVSKGNVWEVSLDDGVFKYRLIRPSREVSVDFNLNEPVDLPPAPWGAEN